MSNTWIKYAVVRWKPRLNRRGARQIDSVVSRHKSYYAAVERLKALGPLSNATVERWVRR